MDLNLLGFMPALLPVALSPGASFTLVMSGALAGGHKGLFRTLAGTALGIYTHAVLIGFANTKQSVTLREAWIANVWNPKAIIFYLTVVSQFAGIQGGVCNYLTLASVHVVVMSVWLYAVSQTLIFSVKKTNPLMLKKYVNIAGGMLLIAFSLHSLIP